MDAPSCCQLRLLGAAACSLTYCAAACPNSNESSDRTARAACIYLVTFQRGRELVKWIRESLDYV